MIFLTAQETSRGISSKCNWAAGPELKITQTTLSTYENIPFIYLYFKLEFKKKKRHRFIQFYYFQLVLCFRYIIYSIQICNNNTLRDDVYTHPLSSFFVFFFFFTFNFQWSWTRQPISFRYILCVQYIRHFNNI